MSYPLNDLGSALEAQLYHTVMGGDETVPPPANTFFTWCSPGIPLQASTFDYATDGLWSAPTAEEAKRRLQHASTISLLLDFIPETTAAYDDARQEAVYRPDAEDRLSIMYREILRSSRVVKTELSDAEKQKLDRFRHYLWITHKVKNIVTEEEEEVTEEGPVLKLYNDKMKAYVAAALVYNGKRIAAASASGPDGVRDVADWANNAELYRLQVKAALDAWVAGGYRNEVDEINAWINQTTSRSMVLWKQQLLEAYEAGKVTTLDVALPFHYATVLPADFASAEGWLRLGVSHEKVDWAKHNKSSSWNAGVGLSWGMWSVGGQGGQAKTEVSENTQVDAFSLEMELAQVTIVRPWFYPEFFANRGWTIRKDAGGWQYDDPPSDGARPPKGKLVGYPTIALFVRNVRIKNSDLVAAYKNAQSSTGVDASIGFGPFKLSGGYHRSQGDETFSSQVDGQSLEIPGMQIIGFVNHLIGKAPNPLPDYKDSDFE